MRIKNHILTIFFTAACFYLYGQESKSEKWSRLNVNEKMLTDNDSNFCFIDILDTNGNYQISVYKELNVVDSAFHYYYPNGNLEKIIGINYHQEDDSLYIDTTLITFYYNENGSIQKEEKIENELHELKIYRKSADENIDTIFIYDNHIDPQFGKSNLTTYADSLKLKTVVIRWFKDNKIILEKTNYLESSNDLIKSYEYQSNRLSKITTYFGNLDSDFMTDEKTLMNIQSYNYKNERLTNINTQRVYPDKETEINTTKFEYNEFGLLSKELLIKDDSVLIKKYYSYKYFK